MRGTSWYAYSRTQALDVIPLPKVFTPDIAPVASYSLDRSGRIFFTGGAAGGYGILAKEPYGLEFLLGILNSRLVDWFHHKVATQMRGGWFSYESRFIRDLPMPILRLTDRTSRTEHDAIVELVTELIALKQHDAKANTNRLEEQLNERVYRLYGLSNADIKTVESSSRQRTTGTSE
jgi:hypothetical protein